MELFDLNQLELFPEMSNTLTMGEDQESQELTEIKDKFLALTQRLVLNYQLDYTEIAAKVGVSYDSFIKYKDGDLPDSKPEKIKDIISKLEKLEIETKSNEPLIARPSLKTIYFPMHMLPEAYLGEFRVSGVPIKIRGIDAIIADPNDSEQFEDAEGLIPAYDPAAENRNGCKIPVKRIPIKDCAWGSEYYIIDKYNQTYLRRLYRDVKNNYRLEAGNPIKYPDKLLKESDILVVFRIIGFYHKART